MLKVTYRKYGIRLSHVYFASEKDIRKNIFEKESGDLIFLHGCADNSVRGGGIVYNPAYFNKRFISK